MRMKFNKSGQLLLVAAASLVAAGLVTLVHPHRGLCFRASAKAAGTYGYGEIDVFEVDSESGSMRQIPTSPFPSGGRQPCGRSRLLDNTNLYVVNHDDNTIVQFHHRQRRQALSAEHHQHAGNLPHGRRRERIEPFCGRYLPAAAQLRDRLALLGSLAVFPITTVAGTPPSDELGTALTMAP